MERQAGSGLTTVALDLQPAHPAVEALCYRRRRLRRSAIAFHLHRPELRLRPIRFTGSLLCFVAGVPCFAPMICGPQMDVRDLVLMTGITAPPGCAGNTTRISCQERLDGPTARSRCGNQNRGLKIR